MIALYAEGQLTTRKSTVSTPAEKSYLSNLILILLFLFRFLFFLDTDPHLASVVCVCSISFPFWDTSCVCVGTCVRVCV
jgi:hypothetical protein